jgi:predicted metal-dependent HD superfamily phosphohydrolase
MKTVESIYPLFNYVSKEVFDVLPGDLFYHRRDHTKRVMEKSLLLADAAGLDETDRILLFTAAVLHDTGYGKKYTVNEGAAAMLASKLLPDYGFEYEEIETIKSMILATNLVIQPVTQLELLLADADLGYLADADFLDWSELLRQEWCAHHDFEGSKADWLQLQIRFLSTYEYFTEEAKQLFDAGKKQNIEQLNALSAWPY